jgi:hypothetical protein
MGKRRDRARRHDPRSMTREQYIAFRLDKLRAECERHHKALLRSPYAPGRIQHFLPPVTAREQPAFPVYVR